MIKAKFFNNHSNKKTGFEITGHAGYADHGEDIVCAAVSVLGYTALNALVEIAGLNKEDMQVEIRETEGFMKVLLQDEIIEGNSSRDIQIILETLDVGIKTVIESYPEYITIEYRGGGTRV